MTFLINDPISLKSDGVLYNLMPGDIANEDIFDPRDQDRFLDNGFITKSKKKTTQIKGTATPKLADLDKMSVAEAKEFLETEYNGTNLEKYLDREESRQGSPRKTVIRFINNRILELTE